LLAVAACFDLPVKPQASYPTLEPDRRVDARAPIDPYGTNRPLHPVEDDHIRADVDFGDPSAVTSMVAEVESGSFALPSSPNHRIAADAAGAKRVTIHVGPGAAVTRSERAVALGATSRIDAADPAIVRAAKKAIAGARTDRERVAQLVSWVHAYMTYVKADESVASVVLARASGDCSEFSLLFVALARASRIPAREVVGLAATEVDGASAFGFHAWAEVELDGHWVQVDPTWNEPVADATHVMLHEGDADACCAGMLELRVAVVDLQHDSRLVGHADARQLAHELPAYLRLKRPSRRK
jgi:transglutaminase-like putative cysteine protease